MPKNQLSTRTDLITAAQPSTNTPLFPAPDTPTVSEFTELLAEYNASISKPEAAWSRLIGDKLADPFVPDQTNLVNVQS